LERYLEKKGFVINIEIIKIIILEKIKKEYKYTTELEE